MKRQRTVLPLLMALGAVQWAAACGDDPAEPRLNRAPEAVDSIPRVVTVTGKSVAVDVSDYFSDPDGDTLSYEAVTSDAGVATASVSGSVVTVETVGKGSATVTVAASDPGGLSAQHDLAVEVVPRTARAALMALYEATGGERWTNGQNWGTPWALSAWFGVTTDDEGRVTGVSLSGNYLSGPIPPELGDLSDLEELDLSRNGLRGPIPPEFGDLSNLRELNLRGNYLSGRIPPELAGLSDLEEVHLRLNGFSGPIPSELGDLANLRKLDLSLNRLSGPIPSELGDLANLRKLDLSLNRLSGPIPPELGGLSNLRELHLWGNLLSGPIPPELGNLANLTWLYLWDNEFTGPIPSELGDLSNLRKFHLGANRLTGPIPPELGDLSNLVALDLWDNELAGPIPSELGDLANLRILDLEGNRLTGPIPPELGDLSNLRILDLKGNGLMDPIPASLARLHQVEAFSFERNDGLCAAGTAGFEAWSQAIQSFTGPFCNASDLAVLTALYDAAGGGGWINSGGWLKGVAPGEWYGVSADGLGRVTGLDLSLNGLKGRIPPSLGLLARMTELKIGGNALSGRVALSMAALPLREFGYAATRLCTPARRVRSENGSGAYPSHEGTGLECAAPVERNMLVSLYDATGGPKWSSDRNWLTDAPIGEWYGVHVDGEGRVTGLSLSGNNLLGLIPAELAELSYLRELDLGWNDLRGSVPPELGGLSGLRRLDLGRNGLTGLLPTELGQLSNLRELDLGGNGLTGPVPPALAELSGLARLILYGNALSGPVPPELGQLSNLRELDLGGNGLTGPVPPALGELSELVSLSLSWNTLSGPIPPELGELTNLLAMDLGGNGLRGPVPPELGDLSHLAYLHLDENALSGPLPSALGALSRLQALELTNNADMSGALPPSLTALDELDALLLGGTELCAPSDAGFLDWLQGIGGPRVPVCTRSQSTAYLVQAVQSRHFPVPLVAGRGALLRVFVAASNPGGAEIPPVRAILYVDGAERHVVDIPGQSTTIPTEVVEGDLSKSANSEIPGRVMRPGLEMVVEIDPDGTLDPGVDVTKRIPETGRAQIDVREVPTLDLTLIPFLWSENPDTSIVGTVKSMAADPENHELLWKTHTLLPVGGLEVTAHYRVVTSSNRADDLLWETRAIRVMEGGAGHYMGMMAGRVTGASGVAGVPGRTSFSVPRASTIAHELGHNLSLWHAPCGNPGFLDPSFPEPDGSIGAWGYDFRGGGRLVSPENPDVMSYCRPSWISEYHFAKALRFRLSADDHGGLRAPRASGRTILLWGGADPEGVPFLNPTFVTGAPPALPGSTGAYEITGRTASGGELFSLSFDMPRVADGDGSSGFAFALPVRREWAGSLTSVTLSGPGGSFTLRGEGERAAVIFLDPRSGQVRGILRGLPPSVLAPGAAEALAPEPGLTVLVSRGIPEPADWR